MNYYILVHAHKHGTDYHSFKSKRILYALDPEEVAEKLDIDYEPDEPDDLNISLSSGETLDIIQFIEDCPEIL